MGKKSLQNLASQEVICRGKVHTLAYDGKSLIFVDHPNWQEEKIARSLGDDTCECLRFAELFARHCDKPFSGPMYTAIGSHSVVVKKRAKSVLSPKLRRHWIDWPDSLFEPHPASIEAFRATANRLYKDVEFAVSAATSWRATPSALAGPRPFTPTYGDSRKFTLTAVPANSSAERYPIVRIPTLWQKKVHARGLTVVDDHLVVDVVTASDVEHAQAVWRVRELSPWWLVFGRTPNVLGRTFVNALRRPSRTLTQYTQHYGRSSQVGGHIALLPHQHPYPYPAEVITVGGQLKLAWFETGKDYST